MKQNYQPKPLFIERMKKLLGKPGFGRYKKTIESPGLKSIRVNTLKISVAELKKRLEEKSWIVRQPFKENPEIFVVEGKYADENSENGDGGDNENDKVKNADDNLTHNKTNEQDGLVINSLLGRKNGDEEENYNIKNDNIKNSNDKKSGFTINSSVGVGEQLRGREKINSSITRAGLRVGGASGGKNKKIIDLSPGELGRSLEHLLGYYYVQEMASMLPALVLNPKPNELVLDLCASPGSKTTQMAAMMQNTGTIIANDAKLDRIKILASNLERCGVMNAILTRKDGVALCKKLKDSEFRFDKILVDAPCSGEGTIRSSPKTLLMWNINTIKSLSKLQKKLLESAIEILKPKGEIVYSTCTHAPEENEEVLDYILNKFKDKIKIKTIRLPVKCSPGILEWEGKKYNKEVEKSCRIYPHISNTEGFFISKLRKGKWGEKDDR